MQDLLKKFEQVEVKKFSTLCEEDRAYCKKCYSFYSEVLECYQEHLARVKDLEDRQKAFQSDMENYYPNPPTFINEYSGICSHETKKQIKGLTESLVRSLCNYFNRKYKCELNRYIEVDNQETLTLENILEKYIFSQLDGVSFYEMAVKQIKEKAWTERYYYEYHKQWNYTVKGKLIKFTININDIQPALYFYDALEKQIIDCYTHNRIADYRSYNNGNTDIVFAKSEYALDFARRFLGYTGE